MTYSIYFKHSFNSFGIVVFLYTKLLELNGNNNFLDKLIV